MIIAAEPTWTAENPEPEYTIEEQGYIAKQKGWATGDERGYSAIQSTKVIKLPTPTSTAFNNKSYSLRPSPSPSKTLP
jgi:hypothetical protein